MDTGRDLACPALWQESLERSLARRGRPTRSSLELFHLRAERDLSRPDVLRESLMYSQLRRSAAARRPSMALPGAGGISALALLAATTLPGLLGGRAGAHPAVGHRADAKDARLTKAPVAGPATDSKLAAKAPEATATEPPASPATTPPAEPSHIVAARTLDHPRAGASTSLHSSTTATTKHVALAHDAADHGAVTSAAHALSGGAAPAAPKLAAAPRVPAEPQPIGHPSTGGGTIEAASHAQTPTRAPHVPTRTAHTPTQTAHPPTRTAHAPTRAPHPPATPNAPAHSGGAATQRAATPHPIKASHPVETSHPVSTSHPKPVPTSHPKPVTATHPVSTAKPAPKPSKPAPAPVAPGHYVNPLAGASVTPERIDQGVDYGGSGTLGAIGNGTVTYARTSGTGWPGAFIEYRLTDGADAGRYVYYAEGVTPAAGLHVGETLRAGQPVAHIIPGSSSGIEIGWGSGVGSQPLAQADGHWSGGDDADSHPSPEGKDFSALIASLGGPPGKIEG